MNGSTWFVARALRTAFSAVRTASGAAAFLYTQMETVSVGFVLHTDALRKSGIPPYELYERFVARQPLSNFLSGGKLVEYSAHLIPEASYKTIPRLYTGGMMVAGDAAALCYTNGLNQEGMNLAVASGFLAAETALEAFARGDFSDRQLSQYRARLEQSFVLKDMKTFEGVVDFMHNERLFSLYPELVTDILQKIYASDGVPKKAFGPHGVAGSQEVRTHERPDQGPLERGKNLLYDRGPSFRFSQFQKFIRRPISGSTGSSVRRVLTGPARSHAPARCYQWNDERKAIDFAYEACLECGTCLVVCDKGGPGLELSEGAVYGVRFRLT